MAEVLSPVTHPREAVALACVFPTSAIKLAKTKLPRESADQKYEDKLSFTVRVEGTLTKLPDEEKPCVVSIPWQLVCAVALSKLNDETSAKILREAVQISEKPELAEEMEKQINERAQVVCDGLVATSRMVHSGKTSFKGVVVKIDAPALAGVGVEGS
jgi:hypothetical protein